MQIFYPIMVPLLFLFLVALVGCAERVPEELQLSQHQLVFEVDADSAPASATLQLDVVDESYDWFAQSSVSWLTYFPASGRGSRQITIQVAPDMLTPGHYTGKLRFTGTQFTKLPQLLEVEITVHALRGVSIHNGNQQVAVINNVLSEPMRVQVVDADGAPRAGTEVTFETVVGASKPARAVVKTNQQGMAAFQPRVLQYGAIGVTATSDLTQDSPAFFQAVVTGWLSTIAGDGIRAWGGDDGPAKEAHFNAPFGMAFLDDDLVLADYFNHAIRKIDLQSGTVHALAGTGKQGFGGDKESALQAVLNGPFGIALTPTNDVVIADYYNNRIRVVARASGNISTIAGTGSAGDGGDGGPAVDAEIDVPLDIAADSKGNVYLSDWHHHVVRKIDAVTGNIELVAGIGQAGYSGEGNPRQAALSTPLGLSFDQYDNLYIADYGNNRVRKIDAATGLISTVAGVGEMGYAGDGSLAVLAKLNRPYNVYADSDGGLFISDAGNHRVRHVDLRSGYITSIAGQGEFGFSGDKDLAVNEKLQGPFSVIKDAHQNVYIAEYFGHRVRKLGAEKIPAAPVVTRTDTLLRQSRQIFGELPGEAAYTSNPVTFEKVALGRSLFHEPRLSRDGTISCSSCHVLEDYGVDGLPVARGIEDQLGERNTPTVFNAALQDSQFWDGREATVESQAKVPILHPKEMGMPDEAAVVAALHELPQYRALFSQAFPGDLEPINFDNVGKALGAFQRRLLTPNAPFDRFIAGQIDALNTEQLLGLEVFLREGCASCHSGPLLGGQDLHLLREYPNTRAGILLELRKHLGNKYKFKVAPLRNIAKTGPYLHDGRDPTLEATLDRRLIAYQVREANIRDTVDMTVTERRAMLAFFEALTGTIDRDYIGVEGVEGARVAGAMPAN